MKAKLPIRHIGCKDLQELKRVKRKRMIKSLEGFIEELKKNEDDYDDLELDAT